MLGKFLPSAAVAILATAGVANAAPTYVTPLYFQGFESNTTGWTGTVTREASGGGPLGVSAFDGSYYGDVTVTPNGYGAGQGNGGFTSLNGNGATPTPYPGAGFSQSISVYIDTSLAPANIAAPAFWIDMSPDSITSDGVGCYPFACSDEQNFNLYYNGSSVGVHATGSTSPVATINSSGWYTFQITYQKGASGADLVANNMNIYDSSGTLLGTASEEANSDGETLPSSNLAGPGYIWLAPTQNGFSGNNLAIDDVRADTLSKPVPEPSALALLATALFATLGIGAVSRKRG